jgi:hypothetical protein
MAITDQDLKLMQSEILSDTSDAGGRITGNEVVDGVSNNLFPDVSELDRTIGRVALRKAFVSVETANRDTFYGANLIVDLPPEDPNVSVSMFTTGSWSDQRSNAANRIESYLAQGPKFDGYLWGQHIAGQKALLLLQRTDRPLPAIGEVLVLVKNPTTLPESQYLRITSVSFEDYAFTVGTTNFTRRVLTLEVSDALLFDVMGGTPHFDDVQGEGNSSRVYKTLVADAAKYYSIQPLQLAADLGDFTVKAASIFTQLVPSAQAEVAISDAKPNAESSVAIQAADGSVSFSTSVAFTTTDKLYVGQSVYNGSLTVVAGSVTIVDAGDGTLRIDGVQVGLIDYDNGILTLLQGSYSGSKTINFMPAARPQLTLHSMDYPITLENRSSTFSFILDPVPAPGSLVLHFMAQGRWYILRDNGSGAIRGDEAEIGAGNVNYTTGSVVLTVGALPDVGSSVIAIWGIPTQERTWTTATLKAETVIELTPPTDKKIQPGSITISWTDGTAKSATDSAGTLTGDATGTVDYGNNRIVFIPNVLPPPATVLNVAYNYGTRHEDTFAAPARDGNGKLNITASEGAIQPGSVRLSWNVEYDMAPIGITDAEILQKMGAENAGGGILTARDDGLGNIKLGSTTIGTVNYATGAVQFDPDSTAKIRKPVYTVTPDWAFLAGV